MKRLVKLKKKNSLKHKKLLFLIFTYNFLQSILIIIVLETFLKLTLSF